MFKLARRARGHFVTLIEVRVHLIRVKPGHISQTGTPKMLCCKDGDSRVKLSLWPFCGRIPGPTDTIWASCES